MTASDDGQSVEQQQGAGEQDAFLRLWTPHRLAYIKGENKPDIGDQDQLPVLRDP